MLQLSENDAETYRIIYQKSWETVLETESNKMKLPFLVSIDSNGQLHYWAG